MLVACVGVENEKKTERLLMPSKNARDRDEFDTLKAVRENMHHSRGGINVILDFICVGANSTSGGYNYSSIGNVTPVVGSNWNDFFCVCVLWRSYAKNSAAYERGRTERH